MCGDGDQCSTKMEIVAGIDPRDGSFGVQRTDQEVCEQVTAYYNPLFVYQHPLMKMKNKATFIDTGFDEDSTASSFILEYDDKKDVGAILGSIRAWVCLDGYFIALLQNQGLYNIVDNKSKLMIFSNL